MKIEREKLLGHLKGVYCGGMIPQAAFSGPFKTAAASKDAALVVVTNGVEGAEDLAEAIGIGASPNQFKRIIGMLDKMGGDTVDVDVVKQRLKITAGNTVAAFVTCDPETVTGGLQATDVQTLVDTFPLEGDGYPMDPDAVTEALAVQKVLSTDYAAFSFGPEQAGIRYGRTSEDQGLVLLPGLVADYSETRLVSPQALIAVLEALGPGARMWPGGQGAAVVLQDGVHTFYLSSLDGEA